MTRKKCRTDGKQDKDALVAPSYILDMVYTIPRDPSEKVEKGKEKITILATMASTTTSGSLARKKMKADG